jgi:hypothetical protein
LQWIALHLSASFLFTEHRRTVIKSSTTLLQFVEAECKGKGHGNVTPLQELWANFSDEFDVNIEWTTSKFGGGSRLFFVRVGSWSKVHPFMTPQQIWKWMPSFIGGRT